MLIVVIAEASVLSSIVSVPHEARYQKDITNLTKHVYNVEPSCVSGIGGQERVELFGGLGTSGGCSDGGFTQRRTRTKAAAPADVE